MSDVPYTSYSIVMYIPIIKNYCDITQNHHLVSMQSEILPEGSVNINKEFEAEPLEMLNLYSF